jgi:hypothetical protein
MTTKGQIVEEALDTFGISGNYESNMIMRGVKNLERMMLAWDTKGIVLGYISSSTPDPEQESGLADYTLQAVVLNLATQLGSVLRLQSSPEIKGLAKSAYEELMPLAPSMASNPYMPLGAGNNWCRSDSFYGAYQQSDDNITTESGVDIITEGE